VWVFAVENVRGRRRKERARRGARWIRIGIVAMGAWFEIITSGGER
jgi:hypothetical protein